MYPSRHLTGATCKPGFLLVLGLLACSEEGGPIDPVVEPISITRIGVTTDTDTAQRHSITLRVPEHVDEGDLLVVNIHHGNEENPVLNPPAGWRLVHDAEYPTPVGTTPGSTVWKRTADAGEANRSYTWRFGKTVETKHLIGIMVAYRGTAIDIQGGHEYANIPGTAPTTSASAPSVTARYSGSVLLVFTAWELPDTVPATAAGTGSMTELADVQTSNRVTWAGEEIVAGGPTGPRVVTCTAPGAWAASSLVITRTH